MNEPTKNRKLPVKMIREYVKVGQYFRIEDRKFIAIDEVILENSGRHANSVQLNGDLAGTPISVSRYSTVEVYKRGKHE